MTSIWQKSLTFDFSSLVWLVGRETPPCGAEPRIELEPVESNPGLRIELRPGNRTRAWESNSDLRIELGPQNRTRAWNENRQNYLVTSCDLSKCRGLVILHYNRNLEVIFEVKGKSILYQPPPPHNFLWSSRPYDLSLIPILSFILNLAPPPSPSSPLSFDTKNNISYKPYASSSLSLLPILPRVDLTPMSESTLTLLQSRP